MMQASHQQAPAYAKPGNSLDAARFESLSGLLSRDPGNAQLRRDCLQAAIASASWIPAEELARSILNTSADDIETRFELATALMGRREFAAAAQELRIILTRRPDIAAAQLNLAMCCYADHGYNEALDLLEARYATGDCTPTVIRMLVSTLHHLNQIEHAVDIASHNEAAARADGPTAGVCALLFLDVDRSAQAARYAAWALAANPDSIDGLTVRATLQAADLDVPQATAHYRRVLELAPQNARAWIGLGTLSLLQQDFSSARTQLETGLLHMPGHLGSWVVLGWTHLLAGDLPVAQQTFQKALELDRTFAETHGALAAVAALERRTTEAQRGIEVALKLDPNCLSAQFATAVLSGAAGNPVAARQLIMTTLAGLGAKSSNRTANFINQLAKQ